MSDLVVKLLAELSRESAPGRYVVALSGGLDSTVLLHALASLRDADSLSAELAAVHINHQLSDMGMEWQAFCAEICQQWQVPLTTREVSVSADGSLEAAARAARYGAFRELVQSGVCGGRGRRGSQGFRGCAAWGKPLYGGRCLILRVLSYTPTRSSNACNGEKMNQIWMTVTTGIS